MNRCNLSTEGSPYDLHSRHTASVGVAAKPCPIFSPDPKQGDLSNIVIKGQNQKDMVYIYFRYSLYKSTSNPSSRYKDFVLINLRLIFQIPMVFVQAGTFIIQLFINQEEKDPPPYSTTEGFQSVIPGGGFNEDWIHIIFYM